MWSLMTLGRILVSYAALCVYKFHSWLKWDSYSFLILSDNYRYPCSASLRIWAVSLVGSVNTINDPTGNGSRWLYNNIATLFNGYCVEFWVYFCSHLKSLFRYIRRTYPMLFVCQYYTLLKKNLLRDFRLPSRCSWGLCSSGMLCSVYW